MRFVLTVLLLLTNVQIIFGQENKTTLKYGVYGIYSEPEIFGRHSIWERRTIYYSYYTKPWHELEIYENGTFRFHEKYGELRSLNYIGKYKIKKDKIILYNFKNDKSRPIPTKFHIRENQLCTIKKTEICYEWQEKSRE
ncbi:MAG: hypothetical protein COY57_00825 [Flavobacteriales bacterium CG_4_10_14_0_8_um_filter_32_5]|nr:MAG: hypothetical protein COY57_00825 [Flavobacteriales bacterium CG_4_10_14_0_8_um_filter_32_5]